MRTQLVKINVVWCSMFMDQLHIFKLFQISQTAKSICNTATN